MKYKDYLFKEHDRPGPRSRVDKVKAGSSHILTWTAWVQFQPSPTHETCLLCSAMSGSMKLACLFKENEYEIDWDDDESIDFLVLFLLLFLFLYCFLHYSFLNFQPIHPQHRQASCFIKPLMEKQRRHVLCVGDGGN